MMQGSGRLFVIVVGALLFISTGVLVYSGSALLRTMIVLDGAKPENALWMGGRLALAHRDMEREVLAFQASPGEKQYEKLKLSLDLLWSATTVYEKNASQAFRKTYESHKALFDQFRGHLEVFDEYIQNKDYQDISTATVMEISEKLAALRPDIDGVGRHIFQTEISQIASLRQAQKERVGILFWEFVIWVILVLILAACFYRSYFSRGQRVQELSDRRERFYDLVNDANFGMRFCNFRGDVIFENDIMAKLGGLGHKKGREARESLRLAEGVDCYAYENGRVALGQDLLSKNGGSLHFRVDMSGTDKLTREIEIALRDHENAADAKSDFLATMSHEMRTPLNGVLGLLSLVLDGNLEAEQRGYVLTAQESAEILLTLIEDILDYSKIEAGKLEFEETEFSISELTNSVCEILAPKAFGKKIDINWHVDPSVPDQVAGDPGRLRQILLNLAGNAVKFTESGGVTIEIALAADQGGELVLSGLVSDTGIGIPYESQDSMFGEFNQLDASFSRRFGGSGLGLAITRRLVEAMGGSIRVFSEPGQGSEFSFSVILKKVDGRDVQLEPRTADSRHVLLWGVGGINNKLLHRSVKALGHQVEFVQNRSDFLESLKTGKADLVILDCHPGDEFGFRLAEKIRNENRDIPVFILYSATSSELENETLSDNIIRGALPKPVHLDDLSKLLDNLEVPDLPVSDVRDEQKQVNVDAGYRLLLVEDSPTNRMVAVTLLKRAGYMIDTAIDGVEAVEAVQRLPYDLILMDISMPNMDGEEASKIIRSLPGSESQTPIIALTAHAMPGDRERFLEAGMDAYLVKPLKAEELLSTIQDYLPDLSHSTNKPIEKVAEMIEEEPESLPSEDIREAEDDRPAILDMGVIDQMKQDAGEEAIPMLINVFKDEVPVRLQEAKSAWERKDITELARAAHTLKSSSGSFGAKYLNFLARELEKAALQETDSEGRAMVDETLQQLEDITRQTIEAYDRLLENYS